MQMNKKELEAFAKEAAKGIKAPEDLNEFSQMLKKVTVEAALNAEMEEHLGYRKHQQSVSKALLISVMVGCNSEPTIFY